MKSEAKYDVVVVGGGPAGYIAAIKSARLGARTALIEKSVVGGTCLNRGCIPTKTYLQSAEMIHAMKNASVRGVMMQTDSISVDMKKALAHKNSVVKKLTGGVGMLLKNNGVDTINGEAKIHPDKTITVAEKTISAEKVIFAGGSMSARLKLPGMESKLVMTSDDALDMQSVPESIVIIGGGVIGVEMATIYAAFGSVVTIIEIADRVLPFMDADISKVIEKSLKSMDIAVHTGTKMEKIEEISGGISVYTDKTRPVSAACALLSVGRVPDTSAVDELDIVKDRGYIKVDNTMKSSIDWIFAPGDINGRMMLAHAAFHMGEVAAENATGKTREANLTHVPSCVYSMPEAGSVGLTQEQAEKKYGDVSVGLFPFSANGRALASNDSNGFVKIIASKKYGEILGVHIVGPAATEIINEAAALMSMEITVNEIAHITHAHPTYSEAFMEAAADALGECLHLPLRK